MLDKLLENIAALKAHFRHDEGEKERSYKDSEGYWTVGVGHLLDAEQSDRELKAMGLEDELDDWEGFKITPEQIEELLDIDIDDTLTMLKLSFDESELEKLDSTRFISLFSMAYQLGSVIKFPAMVKAVKTEDWDRAADEMLWSCGLKQQRRSAWYKQTPNRCQKMADGMRYGSFEKKEPDPVTEIAASLKESDLQKYTGDQLLAEIKRRMETEARHHDDSDRVTSEQV